MSIVNTTIKPFKTTAYQNGKFVEVSDADLKGKWSVVFFYPADFTFVCPTELGDVADKYAEFQKMGVEIYSVSTDTHFTHKAWHDSSETIGKIQYTMIGDPTGQLTRNFENMREAGFFYHHLKVSGDRSGRIAQHRVTDLADGVGRVVPRLVRKMRVGRYRIDFNAERLEGVVVVGEVAEFGRADEGEVGRVEEHD